jgi:serine/threonine protein kinase/WD40 repeat protein
MALTMNERGIFTAALNKPNVAERASYLDGACGNDADLRERIEALLREHDQLGSFLESPAAAPVAPVNEPVTKRPGTVIGPYKLLQQIGEGGMGVVYMAEQLQPMQRKVAVKIIKPGMDSRQVIARFEAERQALALMDHPNIAKVLDAGETPPADTEGSRADAVGSGRPYFVMELVKGMPITQYCEDHRLSPAQRLELFIPVCHAVQHAHQKGIIHRDLKPTNVLIALYDGHPVPKIIDFGVAKAMGRKLTESTLFTEFGSIIGTLEYMSPEQAELNQLDVDTRSDIYSLGVLLYELLTGTTPLDRKRVKETELLEVLRLIREEEPPKPSTRLLQTLRAKPAVGPEMGAASAALRPPRFAELDWIVMKSLEKDRDRRYDTANGLALDLERYLRDEPVSACPPSAGYRFRKLARRHKVAFFITLTVALSLALAVMVLAVSTVRIGVERDEKVTALAQAEKAKDEATRRLYRSLVDDARASRRSRGIGQRFNSLAKLEEAARMARDLGLGEGDVLELRNEVIAFLALPDLRKLREWAGFPEGTHYVVGDHALERYARGDQQGNVDVRRIADDSQVVQFATGVGPMWLEFSPDDRYLSGCVDPGSAVVKVWKIGPAMAAEVLLVSNNVGPVCFSSDSRQFAVAPKGLVQVYDLSGGEAVSALAVKETPTALAFHPFKRQLAVGFPTCVRVLDQDNGAVIAELDGSRGNYCVAWHPDGKRLAAIGSDRVIRQWDIASGRQLARIEGFTNGGIGVTFNRAGTVAATVSWEGKLRLWNPRTGEQIFQTASDWPVNPRFSADDRRLLDRHGKKLRLWELTIDREFRTLTSDPGDVPKNRGHGPCSVCPKNDRLVAAGTAHGIAFWDLADGELLDFLAVRPPCPALFDGTGALLTDIGGGVQRLPFDAGSGSPGAVRLGPPQAIPLLGSGGRYLAFGPPQAIPLLGSGGRNLACSPDGSVVVTGQLDGALVWHRDNPDKVVRLKPQRDVRLTAVSADGRLVATCSHGGVAKVWDARTGDCFKTFEGLHWALVLSPDQKWLFLAGRNQLWKVATWEPGPVLSIDGWTGVGAFSPDSRYLAVETGQGAVSFVHAATGREFARLEDPKQERTHWITFSSDGTKLLTTSGEYNGIHVWDLRAIRQELVKLGLDWDQPAFSPAGDLAGAASLRLTVDLGNLAPKR